MTVQLDCQYFFICNLSHTTGGHLPNHPLCDLFIGLGQLKGRSEVGVTHVLAIVKFKISTHEIIVRKYATRGYKNLNHVELILLTLIFTSDKDKY